MALTRNLQCGDGTRDPFFAAIYLRRGLSGTTGSVQREDVGVEYGGSDEAAAVEAGEQPDQSELRRIESIVREAEGGREQNWRLVCRDGNQPDCRGNGP